MCDSAGKPVKGGYITWNINVEKAGNYDFYITCKYGSGGGSQAVSVRKLKFVVNGTEYDPTTNDMTASEAGIHSSMQEACLTRLALPAGAVELKFGCASDADYRLTYDLTANARLVEVIPA